MKRIILGKASSPFIDKLLVAVRKKSNFCTFTSSADQRASVGHSPPLLVRIGIISSAVGLATPFFATAGFVKFYASYVPRTSAGFYAKNFLTLFGGAGSISLTYNYVIPFFRDHSDFVLPFALANGITAGFWFITGELLFGLPLMSGVASLEILASVFPAFVMTMFVSSAGKSLLTGGLPIGGVVIGGLTAMTAPFLWPAATELCWDRNLKLMILGDESIWLTEFYQIYCLPIGVPVGVISGLSMHLMLKNAILGSPGTPWTKGSLPVLAALVGATFSYFYLLRPAPGNYLWESRMDHRTGEMISYNPLRCISSDDTSLSANAEFQRDFANGIHDLRNAFKFSSRKTERPGDLNLFIVNGDVSAQNVKNRKDLFQIIDILIRYKHLSQNSSGITSEMRRLKSLAADSVGIADLDGFLKTVELTVVARRQSKLGNPGNENNRLVSNVKDSILSFPHDVSGDKSTYGGIHVLEANLPILESELLSKLGYVIADTPEKEQDLIKDYKNERFAIRVIQYGTVLALLGIYTLTQR